MINKVLFDRERRYNEILDLLKEYNLTVVCGKINYPGYDKNKPAVRKAFKILDYRLEENYKFNMVYSKVYNSFDGPARLMVVNMDALEAKKAAIKLEEYGTIGRVFDIDVYIGDGSSIGREQFNLKARRCIICGGDARVCVKTERHDRYEVIAAIDKIIDDYGELDD